MDQQSCVVKEGDQVKDQDEKDWRLSDEKEGRGVGGRGPNPKKKVVKAFWHKIDTKRPFEGRTF